MSAPIEIGARVKVQLEGRVVARDEMGDGGYLIEYHRDGQKVIWVAPEIVELFERDGGGI